MVTFNIVTPAGGNKEELYATVNSIIVATKKKSIIRYCQLACNFK